MIQIRQQHPLYRCKNPFAGMAYVTQKGSWRKKSPSANIYFSSATAQSKKPVYHGPMIPKFSVVKPYWEHWQCVTLPCIPLPPPQTGLLVPLCVPLLASELFGTCSMAALSPSHLMSPLLFMGPFRSGVTQTWSPHISQHFWLWLNSLVQSVTEPVKMKARKYFPCYHLVLSLSLWQSLNLRMVEVDKDVWRSSTPTTWSKNGQLQQVAQHIVQSGLEHLQGWRQWITLCWNQRHLNHSPMENISVCTDSSRFFSFSSNTL